MAPDHNIGVLDTGSEHMDTYLAGARRRQGSVDYLQAVRLAEALDLNHPVMRF
jgi:hypothetical protein